MKNLFPMFVKLEGRPVLVVGGGNVAAAKVGGLLETGAGVRVIALQANEALRELADSGQVTLEERAFRAADLDGIFLVVVATELEQVNQVVCLEARRRGVLCNVVDVPEQCDFFYPALVRRGDLQIAISTAGQSPSLAQKIRQQLERQFGPGWAEWVAELGATRRDILRSDLNPQRKRTLLQSLASREAFEAAVSTAGQGGGTP